MKYHAIVGQNSQLIIGACTDQSMKEVAEKHGATLVEITKQEYNWIGAQKSHMVRLQRMLICNQILRHISEHGRKFFLHNGKVSRFEIHNGRLWYRDKYSDKLVYVAYQYRWRGFSEGGTLRSLVENLRDFINHRKPIRNHFGPWPGWISGDGDLWGYGPEAMEAVRAALAYPLEMASRAYKVPKKKEQTA